MAPVPLRGPAFIVKESVQMYTATLGLCTPQARKELSSASRSKSLVLRSSESDEHEEEEEEEES